MTKPFNSEDYYSHLRTRFMGRPCKFLNQVETTIDVAASEKPGTIVIANEQLKGRGQRGNTWHSPSGCAMASLRLVCGKLTPIASRICFLQHVLALAAAKTLENIDNDKLGQNRIKLKWPNDIVYTNSTTTPFQKIGGILVHTKDMGDEYDITLSFGLNVFNSEPTTCVSDIIGKTSELSIDLVVANVMNNLEEYTDSLTDSTFKNLKEDYTKRCIQINKLIEDERHGIMRVKEVDDEGYLIGERCDDSKICTITKIVQYLEETSTEQ